MRFFCASPIALRAIRLRATPIASQYGYAATLLPLGKGQYAPRFGYLPAGKYASLWATPIASQYGYAAALLPLGKGQYAPRFGYLPAGKYASQIYTLQSYSKKHQYIAIPKQNVRIFRFIPTK